MHCYNCGNNSKSNATVCSKCGKEIKKNTATKRISIISIFIVMILACFSIYYLQKNNYYFTNLGYEDEVKLEENETKTVDDTLEKKITKYTTSIVSDNTYAGVPIITEQDAIKLIKEDSIKQKESNLKQISEIEDNIVNNYNIVAVNLKELDIDSAKKIENIVFKIYEKYPSARGFLTNISLTNTKIPNEYVAKFIPAFKFATSNNDSKYTYIMKTQILLNSSYFLNLNKLQAIIDEEYKLEYYQENVDTTFPIVHEFGDYLSFVAMFNNYNVKQIKLIRSDNFQEYYKLISDYNNGIFSKKILEEAYLSSKKDISLEEYIDSVLKISNLKSNEESYMYNEVVAHAFVDSFFNGDNAKMASTEIVNILNKYVARAGEINE